MFRVRKGDPDINTCKLKATRDSAQCAREPNFLQKVSIFLEQAYFHFKTTLSNLKLHEKSFKRVFKTIRRIFDIIY